jgi:hypothetical protein
MSLVLFTENHDLTNFKFDPRALLSTPYDMIYDAMVQNDDFEKGRWMGKFLLEKLNQDVEAHDTSKKVRLDNTNTRVLADALKAHDDTIKSISAMNELKHLVLLSTHKYAVGLQGGNHEKRNASLVEIKTLLTPFFTEHHKQNPGSTPQKKKGLFSFLKP